MERSNYAKFHIRSIHSSKRFPSTAFSANSPYPLAIPDGPPYRTAEFL